MDVQGQFSRRRFLQVSALTVIVSACQDRPRPSGNLPSVGPVTTPSAASTGLGDHPFDVWESMRAALRTSPDHLVARADNLVATGDVDAIFRFVRDEIATLPSQDHDFGNAETAIRWGNRAALRCGAGTPREKAELLAELLRLSGAEAEVRTGTLRPEIASRADLLYRPIPRHFAPAVDTTVVDGWLTTLGPGTAAPSIPVVDADGAEGRALAAALRAQVPAASSVAFDRSFSGRVPIVVMTAGGVARFANPLVPNAELGTSYLTQEPVTAAPPSAPLQLDVAILATRSDDPNTRTVLVEGSWSADQLVGRHLQLGFAPVGGLAALAGRTAGEVQLFHSFLAVRSPELTRSQEHDLAVGGRSVSTGGRVLDVSSDGTPTIDGVPLASAPSTPAGAGSVARVDPPIVRVAGFPLVQLTLAPRDDTDAIVAGLGAADIRVEEEGKPVAFLMVENQPRQPRVLLLLDTSNSIPENFRGGFAADLGRKLAAAILGLDPAAQFLVGAINYGTVSSSGDWTGDPAAVASNVALAFGDGSDLWQALGEATALGASVVVMITDGGASDTPEEVIRGKARVAAGPPVITLGVGKIDRSFGDEVARLTGGAQALASDVGPAVAAVAKALAAIRDAPYRLEYRATAAGPSNRAVRVTIGKAMSEGSYEVPATPLQPTALAGLYLRLRVTGGDEITRTLAGLDHREYHPRGDPLPAGTADDVLGALFGGALMSVEGDGPTLSAWLDGFLAAKLTLQPAWAAIRAHDDQALQEAMAAVSPIPPPALLPFSAPLPDHDAPGSLTFPAGLRCALYRERLVFGQGRRRSVDLLPTARWQTAAADPRVAFDRTLERTAHLAIAEKDGFQTSTVERLAGRALQLVPAGTSASRSGPLAAYARRLDEYVADDRLVPTDGGPFAMWVIRSETGGLEAILPDGSGGGEETEPDAGVEKGAAVAGILGSLVEIGFVGGAFIALQKAIARETMRLAAWILTIGDEGEAEDPNLGDPLRGLGCDLAKEAIAGLSHTTEYIDLADKFIEAAGGHGIPCPG
ncbi:MAG: hypothetical protein ABI598_04535 [Chloroflexota bacterium]